MFEITFILAQLFGIVFLVATYIKMQKKDIGCYLKYNAATNFLFAIHIFFLGVPLIAMVSALAGIRCMLLLNPKIWACRKALAPVFLMVFGLLFFITNDDVWLYWLLLGPITGILAEIQGNMLRTRILLFINAGVWLVFSVVVFSWPGIICEIVLISSNIIGLFRYHLKPLPSTKAELASNLM